MTHKSLPVFQSLSSVVTFSFLDAISDVGDEYDDYGDEFIPLSEMPELSSDENDDEIPKFQHAVTIDISNLSPSSGDISDLSPMSGPSSAFFGRNLANSHSSEELEVHGEAGQSVVILVLTV